MSRLTFTIPGPPCALQRHRSAIRGKGARQFVQQYDPAANKSNKARIQHFAVLAQREAGVKMLSGPLGLSIVARFPRPRSHYGTGKNAGVLKTSAPHSHTQKPDLSNILKIVEDALNKVAWRDDSEIASLAVDKCWTTDGGEIEVEVWEREEKPVDNGNKTAYTERTGVKGNDTDREKSGGPRGSDGCPHRFF